MQTAAGHTCCKCHRCLLGCNGCCSRVAWPSPRWALTNRIAGAEPGLPDEAGEGSLQDLCLQKGCGLLSKFWSLLVVWFENSGRLPKANLANIKPKARALAPCKVPAPWCACGHTKLPATICLTLMANLWAAHEALRKTVISLKSLKSLKTLGTCKPPRLVSVGHLSLLRLFRV